MTLRHNLIQGINYLFDIISLRNVYKSNESWLNINVNISRNENRQIVARIEATTLKQSDPNSNLIPVNEVSSSEIPVLFIP